MKKTTTLTLLALMLVTSLHETQAQVCTFPGEECCGEGITNFQLNGTPAINRTSTVNENAGFTNTGVTSAVVAGQTYNYSVTFPVELPIVDCNTYNFKIYIDYNHDFSLTDPGEQAVSLANVPNGTYTGSFTIPTTASTGSTYMRVMMKMSANSLSGGFCGHSAITPCNNPPDPVGYHGEVENYTLDISSPTGISTQTASDFGLRSFPNPVSDKLTVHFSLPESSEIFTSIYNVLGKRIYVVSPAVKPAGAQTLSLSIRELNIEAGVYFLEIQAGNRKQIQRFVVL